MENDEKHYLPDFSYIGMRCDPKIGGVGLAYSDDPC
jgi:hypothetical protein